MKECSGSTYNKKRNSGICVVYGCSKKSRVYKGKSQKYCHNCARKLLKENHPYTYWYDINRSNAKRRNKDFLWTKEEFIKFCEETNYLELKGRGAGKATIDRKNPKLGYTYNNCQIMEHASNSRKVWIDKKMEQYYNQGGKISDEEMKEFLDQLSCFDKEVSIHQPINKDFQF